MTKSNAMWSSLWNIKGNNRIAMETAGQKLKNPMYTTYFGETGNFHKPGNTKGARQQRITAQHDLVKEYLAMLRGPQPRRANVNRQQKVANAYVRMMQATKTTGSNATRRTEWNAKGPKTLAKETAMRRLRDPSYAPSPGEYGNFRKNGNDAAGAKRLQRIEAQKRLIERTMTQLKQQCETMTRMQRAGAKVFVPPYCASSPAVRRRR